MILGDEEDVDKQENEKQKQPRIINFPSDGSEISPAPLGSADRAPKLDSGCVHNGQNYKFEEEFKNKFVTLTIMDTPGIKPWTRSADSKGGGLISEPSIGKLTILFHLFIRYISIILFYDSR